ncbi:MAG: AAA family ATPase [Candidatus Omnitrophica bacterium]|nr:AAA family ATPase [Candidatus Omnitrophota bacterium]
MSYTIGFAGKGGTGKTTIASLVIRYLAEKRDCPVLAIDADPNANLGEMLGLEADETVVGVIDDISANIEKLPAGVTKERLIESRVQQSLGEGRGMDLLVMGRPEGPGCYCYPNSLLRGVIGKLQKAYKYIAIDNEAGLEHLSRRTDRSIDYLFIISDPTAYGIRSAKRVLDLAKDLKVSRGVNHLLINRVKDGIFPLEEEIKKVGAQRVDYLPESKIIMELSARGEPINKLDEDTELVRMIYKICEDAKWH